jgi:two-component system response regulator DegU
MIKITRIILVDDHLFFREGVKSILDNEPSFEVVGSATNGIEALNLVDTLKPDIVLMDVNMPEMDGIEATKEIVTLHPNTKVVMLSVHAEKSYVIDSLKNGASGYIIKETTPPELIGAITQVVKGHQYLHPEVTGFVIDALVGKNQADTLEAHPPLEILTVRECEVLQLLADGHSNGSMAEYLHISEKTVKNHMTSIFQKIKVEDRTNAVLLAIKKNWVTIKQ